MQNREEITEQLNEGFKHLSCTEKMTLTLFYFEELNEAEICRVLDIAYEAVDMALTTARMKMRAFTTIFDEIDNMGKRGISITRGRCS